MRNSQPLGRFRPLLATLLFVPVTAIAADWVLVYADENTEVEVDRQSLKPNKGAWFKFINTPPERQVCGAGKETADLKLYIEANCKEFTVRTKQSIAYSEDGKALPYCGFNSPAATFTEFAPETMGEVFFKAICHPSGRQENRYAKLLRTLKADKKRADEAAKQRAELEATKQLAEQEAARRRAEAEAAHRAQASQQWLGTSGQTITPKGKPAGAVCGKSSECAGLLVCERTATLEMRCMSSSTAIRLNAN